MSEVEVNVSDIFSSIYHGVKLLADVAVAASLLVIAVEVAKVTYNDGQGHYIMNIGTHDIH